MSITVGNSNDTQVVTEPMNKNVIKVQRLEGDSSTTDYEFTEEKQTYKDVFFRKFTPNDPTKKFHIVGYELVKKKEQRKN